MTSDEDITGGGTAFHIHPLLHNRYKTSYEKIADESAVKYGLILFCSTILFTGLASIILIRSCRFLCFTSEKYITPVTVGFVFLVAGMVCYDIDMLLWGGSLDFICYRMKLFLAAVSPTGENHFHPFYGHLFCFDLKDVFLWVGALVLAFGAAGFVVNLLKRYFSADKEERKKMDSNLSKNREKHR